MLARFTAILLFALLGTSLLSSPSPDLGEVDKVFCAVQPELPVSQTDSVPDTYDTYTDFGGYVAIPSLIILVIHAFIFGFIAPVMDLAQVWYRITSFIHRLCHTLIPTHLVVFIRPAPRIPPTWLEDVALPHFARLTVLRRIGSVTAA